jgi:hypothetical protein
VLLEIKKSLSFLSHISTSPTSPTSPTSLTMDLRGQRFTVDFSDDEDEDETPSKSRLPSANTSSTPSAFIGDIKERPSAAATPPKFKSTTTGFPEHKKRTRISAFKQQREASSSNTSIVSPTTTAIPGVHSQPTNNHRLAKDETSLLDQDRRQIDEENSRRLAAMSAEEIDEERQELFAGLNPSLIERLLKRANLDEGRGDTGFDIPIEEPDRRENIKPDEVPKEKDIPVPAPKPTGRPVVVPKSIRFEEDEVPAEPIDLRPISQPSKFDVPQTTQPSMHFPTAPSAPELNPSDPEFLENLHSKYFPSLPADPSKLAWMAPLPTHGSIADQESPYYPGQDGISASALRFDFRGGILPPRIARAVPVTKGLHHHGEAPEAAGYTVPELARLARSAFPAQRCVAFQTLGRLLYRLGRGNFGPGDSEVVRGLWKCVEDGKVIQTLEEAASAEGGHQGSKTYAIEAVWLWQKGGGKQWKAT